MFKRFRALLLIGALLVGVVSTMRLISTQAASSSARTSVAPDISRVDQGDVALSVTASGNIQANQQVPLNFTTTGIVKTIDVKEGDYILKGQTIATLADQDAQDALTTAQLKVEEQQLTLNKLMEPPRQVDIDVAQANIKLAQANVTESEISPTDGTQLQIAQANIDMSKNLLWQAQLNRDINTQKNANSRNPQPGSIAADDPSNRSLAAAQGSITVSQDQLTAAQSQGANYGSVDAAQANLTAAQTQLKILMEPPNPDDIKQAQANVAAAQAAVVQAQQTLDKTRLVAPFDGQVAAITLNVGQAPPASGAVTFVDVSSFYVDLPVAETDIAKVSIGMPVQLHFDALGTAVIAGKVSQISDTANTGTPVSYNVRVLITPAGAPLLSTMSTTANIVISNAANVVRLANRYIRLDTAHKKAYATVRQTDGTFKEVSITLGATNDTYTEVKSGLQVGDVVTTPSAGAGGGGPGGGAGFPVRAIGG